MNYSHLNRLSVVMRALERAAIEIEGAVEMTSDVPTLIMSTCTDPIPESVKGAIREKLAEVRDEIKDAKEHYGLSPEKVSIRRHLSSKLLILGIDLTECRAEHLRGYGEVPNEEKDPLNQRMSRLEAMVDELRILLTSGGA